VNRMENYAKILAIFESAGTIHSRIKIQKMIYILKSLGYPLNERYEYRHFGPYSEQLASELTASVNTGFLDEKEADSRSGDDLPPDYQRFDLSLTDRGRKFLEVTVKKNQQLGTQAEGISRVAKHLQAYSPTELELIATLMYLQDQKVPTDQLNTMLRNLKPKFTPEQASKAIGRIEGLRAQLSLTV
jgi:uncharacterized protein YwgA